MMKPPQNRSKHQHWVPQFYLNYFATPETRDTNGEQVWIIDKASDSRESKLTSVRNVCGKRYLYSPKNVNGQRDWSLDEKLNGIESDLGLIWPSLCEDTPSLTDTEIRDQLALFVAITHLRNLEIFNLHDRTIKLRNRLYGPLPAGRIKPGGPDATDAGRMFTQMLILQTEQIAKKFSDMNWAMLLADEDIFITTDRPVGFLHRTLHKAGPGTKGAISLFPISPRRLLVMSDGGSWDGYARLPAADAGMFNRALWQSAVRFAITGRSVEEVLQEIDSE
jgi:hypothetical protein